MQIKALNDMITKNLVVDPDTPLGLLSSNFTDVSTGILDTMIESKSIYPSRASTYSEVMRYLADEDLKNVFFSPPSTILSFYLNKLDIIRYGEVNNGVYEVVIPNGTTITVDHIQFVIINEIYVRLVNGRPVCETYVDDEKIEVGKLLSEIARDVDGVEWVLFDLPVYQRSINSVHDNILKGVKYDTVLPFVDGYSGIEIIMASGEKINLTYSDELLPDDATAKISILNQEVRVEIPIAYTELIYGEMTINVYSTIGDKTVDLTKYPMTEFEIILNEHLSRDSAISNVAISVNSNYMLTGGATPKSIEEVRRDIINRANGNKEFPITEYDILEHGRSMGIKINKELDILYSRLYSGSRPLDVEIYTIDSLPIVGMGTVGLTYDLINTSSINKYGTGIIINAGTLFKEHGDLSLLTDTELYDFGLLDTSEQVSYINTENVMYTPFLYVVGYENDLSFVNAYDIKNIGVKNLDIISKNLNSDYTINIKDTKLIRNNNSFDLFVELIGADEGGVVLNNNLQALLEFQGVYFTATKVQDSVYKFTIDSSGYVDENKKLYIEKGIETYKVDLITRCNFYLHNPDMYDGDMSYPINLLLSSVGYTTKAFTHERFDLVFLKELKYLWTENISGFTSDIYKKYENDIYATYDKDVFEVFSNGCIVDVLDGGEVVTNLIHAKGDIIYDDDGIPILLHKKGETILVDGEGIKDFEGKYFNKLDILVLDYKYKYCDTELYNSELDKTYTLIDTWLDNDFYFLNRNLLERTSIKFKPHIDFIPIKINLGRSNSYKTARVTPTVYLNTNTDELELTFQNYELVKIIGNIITAELNKTLVDFNSIRKVIGEVFGTMVTGVVIKDLVVENSDQFNSVKTFHIGRKLKYNKTVVYDMDVKINRVL